MAQRQGPSIDRLDHGSGQTPDDGRDPVPDEATSSIGAELRDARLKLGQELADVASVLRIRRVFLEAIEEGQFDRLPGAPYAIGFVRAYADHLGLDQNEVVRCFKDEASGIEHQTDLAFPEVITESRIPRGAILLISAVLVVAAYGGWYYLSAKDIAISDIIPEVPKRLVDMIAGDEPESAAQDPAPKVEAGIGESAPPASADAAITESNVASPPAGEEKPKEADKPASPMAADRAEPAPMPQNPSPPEAVATSPAREMAPTGAGERSPRAGDSEVPVEAAPVDEAGGEAPTLPAPEPFAASPAALGIEPTAETRPETVVVTASGDVLDEGRAPVSPAPVTSAALRPEPGPETAVATVTAGPETPPKLPVARVPGVPGVPQRSGTLAEHQPRIYGKGNSDSRVIVRATRDSWIQVHGADNALLLTRILRAGDSYRVPNRDGLTLMTGNAGALEILVDGEPVPPIGPFGAVRRDISLDANRLKTGSAATN